MKEKTTVFDLQKYINIDVEDSLEERFMKSEKMYVRFLRKLLRTKDFMLLDLLITDKNAAEAERKAHNLKGVCANLGLVDLQAGFTFLVKHLRSERVDWMIVYTKMEELRPLWYKTIDCIRSIDD